LARVDEVVSRAIGCAAWADLNKVALIPLGPASQAGASGDELATATTTTTGDITALIVGAGEIARRAITTSVDASTIKGSTIALLAQFDKAVAATGVSEHGSRFVL
jgi:hypothetical protein